MKSPYKTDEETIIAMSGGRTSAYMLWRVLQEYGGKLPEHIKVVFFNTGKEMPETLDFVRDITKNWNVEIAWIERYTFKSEEENKKYRYELKIVDHSTAARNGEPFRQIIEAYGQLPNPVSRYCSAQLKTKATAHYAKEILGWETPVQSFIGIRADEHTRGRKIHNSRESGQDRFCPLWVDGVSKYDVFDFWKASDFDLNLPNNNGVTDWGNCDICFLKAASKKQSIIKARPDLAKWWIKMEDMAMDGGGNGDYWRIDHPSVKKMALIATDGDLFGFPDDEETIPCFCGD